MASTEAQIVNIALLRVGSRAVIDSLDEATTEAQVAKIVYAHVRDTTLAAFAWPFATKRADLALLADVERSGWTYVYALPADCLEAQRLWSGSRVPTKGTEPPFELEATDDLSSRLLLTDTESAELIYTAKVTAVSVWPPLFVDALAWALAAEFCLSLPVKPELSTRAQQRYQLALAAAKSQALREAQDDPPPNSEFITIRS